MSFKSLFIAAAFISTFSLTRVHAAINICGAELVANCAANLHSYPLFDTEYKLAANYLPILALRALAHAEVYKDKKSSHLERYYYVKDLQGKFSKPYQSSILDIEVQGHGFLGREVKAKGKLNEFNLEYNNQLCFSLPRKAHMKAIAKLDDIPILNLDIESDGITMTNAIEGVFLGKEVQYKTTLRDTEGMLGEYKYILHTEGKSVGIHSFEATTKGIIGSTSIAGKGRMVRIGYYEFEENYGPILVKTKLTIKP